MDLTPYQLDIINAKICPYCKSSTEVVSETDIYGREYKGRLMIRCRNYQICDAYVGCHKDGTPLGRLARKELRNYKKEAHQNFDRLWKEKYLERSEAYEMLADHLGLADEYTHIGMFSIKTCKKVIEWSIDTFERIKAENEEIKKDFTIR